MSEQPHILLLITGSIAAIKVFDVIRGLKESDAQVTCVVTEGGKQFVTPLSLASVTENKVYDDLFSLTDEVEMGHIRLSREADVVAVVPASADFIGKVANGLCNDLASTIVLASDKPVMMAPAMNVKMWEHPAVQRNVAQLQADGVQLIGPVSGDLACGEEGEGRMAEPDDIVATILDAIGKAPAKPSNVFPLRQQSLAGLHAIVTSGPTREKLDPVRYLSNRSSGKQGYAIANALIAAGAEVTLVSGPTSVDTPKGANVVWVESAQEMYDAVHKALPCDIAVCCAAVSDWRANEVAAQKIKKEQGLQPTFTFAENPDILVSLSKQKAADRPKLVVGFAAETEHVVENARVKLERKKCDWIVANDVLGDDVFESDDNHVHLVLPDADEDWGPSSKVEVAEKLVERISEFFDEQPAKKTGSKTN